MHKKAYINALRYSYKLRSIDYIDRVHDAYLVWWDKYKKDLFDEPGGRISTVIRYRFLEYLSKDRTGFKYGSPTKNNYTEFADHVVTTTTPLDVTIANEIRDKIRKTIVSATGAAANAADRQLPSKILTLRFNGYNNTEVAEELGISKSLVTHYINKTKFNSFDSTRIC